MLASNKITLIGYYQMDVLRWARDGATPLPVTVNARRNKLMFW